MFGGGLATVRGGDGNDWVIWGGTGAFLDGGAGTDLLRFNTDQAGNIVFSIADPSVEQVVHGTRIVNFERVDFTASSGNDTLTGGAFDDIFYGGFGNDIIHGGDGNDELRGESGQNQLFGDGGNDTLYKAADLLIDGGAGIDLAIIPVSGPVTLDVSDPSVDQTVNGTVIRNVERIRLSSSGGANHITGGAYDDVIGGAGEADVLSGGGGNDSLSGGGGIDQLSGGAGDDELFGATNDLLVDGGDGFDFLMLFSEGNAFITIDLLDPSGSIRNVERLDFSAPSGGSVVRAGIGADTLRALHFSTATDEFHGREGDDALFGGGGDDLLFGDAGDDFINGGLGGNELHGGDGNDQLSDEGSEGSYLDGGSGDDGLSGGTGADTLIGGSGDDLYIIDNAGDVAIEFAGEGVDEIRTTLASYSLTDVFENLTSGRLTNAPQSGQTLIGNALDNRIVGSVGNDTIIGGLGADTMHGSNGNDTFYVDNAADFVWEFWLDGNDRIATSVSYVLGVDSYVERLEAITLSATDAMDLTGNFIVQSIVGNDGANILRGEDGNDTLYGGGATISWLAARARHHGRRARATTLIMSTTAPTCSASSPARATTGSRPGSASPLAAMPISSGWMPRISTVDPGDGPDRGRHRQHRVRQ